MKDFLVLEEGKRKRLFFFLTWTWKCRWWFDLFIFLRVSWAISALRTGSSKKDLHALITFLCFSSVCRFVVNETSNTCNFCGDITPDSKSTFVSFDILVDLTDHTGTLYSCYLSDCIAEETLGCTVSRNKWGCSYLAPQLRWNESYKYL